MPLTSTWPAEDGDCALDDLVQQPATHGTAPHDLATRVKLLKPSNSSNNCVITFTPPQPGSWTALALTSTARTVEVSAQSAGGAMSYITTVRAQSLAGSTWQKATVPLKVWLGSCILCGPADAHADAEVDVLSIGSQFTRSAAA